MHMTLLFLGEVSDDAARKVTDDFSKISFPKFEYRIRGISVFPNQNFVRVVWAGCETAEEGKFDSLYGEVCQKLGTTSEEKFVPHVTLARVKTRDASAASAEFVRAHERLDLGTTLAARLVLKQSVIVNYSPPRYSDVASVGLS